jgi:hypothetical protein
MHLLAGREPRMHCCCLILHHLQPQLLTHLLKSGKLFVVAGPPMGPCCILWGDGLLEPEPPAAYAHTPAAAKVYLSVHTAVAGRTCRRLLLLSRRTARQPLLLLSC